MYGCGEKSIAELIDGKNPSDSECIQHEYDEETDTVKDDAVKHPGYYTKGQIECIDFIQDKNLNFCRGNVVKYVVRAGIKSKATEIEDLKKARQYLDFEIKRLEK
jgi:hypothetical protein